MNSTNQAEPVRRKISKLNSNNKITESKVNVKDAIVPPSTGTRVKRNITHLNINTLRGDKKEKSDPLSVVTSRDDEPGNNTGHNTPSSQLLTSKLIGSKKLKGPKINVTAEPRIDASSQSIVTKLKSWKEFFDVDEFQSGLAAMKEDPVPDSNKKDEEEDGGSDSEPSVDNFDCRELEDNLCAALDLKEGELNPFEAHEEEQQEDKIEQEQAHSEKDGSEDQLSLQEMRIDDGNGTKDDEVLSSERQAVTQPADTEQQEKQSASEPPISESLDAQSSSQTGVIDRARRGRASNRRAAIDQQIEQERQRIMKYPDLANQLINQLILQNNQRQIKASAAPPSGWGQLPAGQGSQPLGNQLIMNQNSLAHQQRLMESRQQLEIAPNHVLRGFSYSNQPTTKRNQQILGVSDQGGQPDNIYFTEQNRLLKSRNPSTHFTVLGQGVVSLNNSQDKTALPQQHQSSSKKQKKRLINKGLAPLLPQDNDGEWPSQNQGGRAGAPGSQGTRPNNTESRHNQQSRYIGQGRGSNAHHSESRNTNRAGTQRVQQIGNAAPQQQMAVKNRQAIRSDNLRGVTEQQPELNSQRSYMNETLGSSSSKAKRGNVRGSRDHFLTKGREYQQKVANDPQRAQEATSRPRNQQRVSEGFSAAADRVTDGVPPGYIIKTNFAAEFRNNVFFNSQMHLQPQNHQTLEARERMDPGSGRQSEVHIGPDERQVIANTQLQGRAPQVLGSTDHFLPQFAYSPIQYQDTQKRSNLDVQMSAPQVAKKQSFNTPRYQRIARPAASNGKMGLDSALHHQFDERQGYPAPMLEVRGNPSQFNIPADTSPIYYHNNSNLLDRKQAPINRAISYDRNTQMDSTYKLTQRTAHQNLMNSPISVNGSKGLRQTELASAHQSFDNRQQRATVQQYHLEDDRMDECGDDFAQMRRTHHTTPASNQFKDVLIRKKRNARPVQQPQPSYSFQPLVQTSEEIPAHKEPPLLSTPDRRREHPVPMSQPVAQRQMNGMGLKVQTGLQSTMSARIQPKQN